MSKYEMNLQVCASCSGQCFCKRYQEHLEKQDKEKTADAPTPTA